jgi:hypothetical protein
MLLRNAGIHLVIRDIRLRGHTMHDTDNQLNYSMKILEISTI